MPIELRVLEVWLRWLGESASTEAMLGDILERFGRERSRFWLCKEALTVALCFSFDRFKFWRHQMVKRAAITVIMGSGVFALGFLTARSPYLVQEEMPSPEVIEKMHQDRTTLQRLRTAEMRQGTLDFLRQTVRSAEAQYSLEPSPQNQAQLERVRSSLEEVLQRYTDLRERPAVK